MEKVEVLKAEKGMLTAIALYPSQLDSHSHSGTHAPSGDASSCQMHHGSRAWCARRVYEQLAPGLAARPFPIWLLKLNSLVRPSLSTTDRFGRTTRQFGCASGRFEHKARQSGPTPIDLVVHLSSRRFSRVTPQSGRRAGDRQAPLLPARGATTLGGKGAGWRGDDRPLCAACPAATHQP
jgi:hypothetical protein